MTATDAVRALRQAGWFIADQEGSHAQLAHSQHTGKVTVPMHRGRILKPKTLSTILKQAGLTADEFRKLL